MAVLATYIQTPYGKLSPQKNSNIPINKSIKDIQDLSKRKGGYTKTILIPGTKEANKIFSYYYDVNIVDGTFNHKKKMDAELFQDGILVLSGYVRLLSISRGGNPADNLHQDVVYQVTITDETSSLFQNIGNQQLSDLDVSYMNHNFKSSNIIGSISNDYTDGYKYIWPYTDTKEYKLNEFVPAIYARELFDKVFSSAGYTYDWSSIDNYKFNELLLTYNKTLTDGIVGGGSSIYGSLDSSPAQVYENIISQIGILVAPVEINDIISDPSNNVSIPSDNYTSNTYTTADNIRMDYKIKYKVELFNNSGADATLFTDMNLVPALEIYKDGVFDTSTFKSFTEHAFNNINVPDGQVITDGQVLEIQNETYSDTFQNSGSSFVLGDITTNKVAVYGDNDTSTWKNGVGVAVLVGIRLTVESIEYTIDPASKYPAYNSLINLNSFLPQNIKSSDFIKGIFNHFNLYAEVESSNPTNIIIKGRDEYYDDGEEYNWTNKISSKKQNDIKFRIIRI